MTNHRIAVWTLAMAFSQLLPQAVQAQSDIHKVAIAARDDGRDDTAVLQAAVNARVGALRLAPGTYELSSTVVVDLDVTGPISVVGTGPVTVRMNGPGPAFRFVGTHFGTANPRTVQASVWKNQRMPVVDGVAIVGAHAKAIGIEAIGTMQLTISRVHIRNCLHAIHLVKNNRNLLVSECHLYENRGIGVFYDDVNLHQSNITACHISYNRGGGIVARKGNIRNIHISGCDIEGNMSPESPATANVLLDSRGGSHGTGEVAITGCTIQHDRESPNSANIRVIGLSGDRETTQQHEGHTTITGNILSDVRINVHLVSCRGVVMTGNTCWQGYDFNLLAERCSNLVIGSNNFDRNPRYRDDEPPPANGLAFRHCTESTLTGLHLNGVACSTAALELTNCELFNVTGCSVLNSAGVGILLHGVRQCRVSDCLIRGKASAIVQTGGDQSLLADNLLEPTGE